MDDFVLGIMLCVRLKGTLLYFWPCIPNVDVWSGREIGLDSKSFGPCWLWFGCVESFLGPKMERVVPDSRCSREDLELLEGGAWSKASSSFGEATRGSSGTQPSIVAQSDSEPNGEGLSSRLHCHNGPLLFHKPQRDHADQPCTETDKTRRLHKLCPFYLLSVPQPKRWGPGKISLGRKY